MELNRGMAAFVIREVETVRVRDSLRMRVSASSSAPGSRRHTPSLFPSGNFLTFEVTRFQAGLIQSAFYMGYFVLAMPAALLMRKLGYKAGFITGLHPLQQVGFLPPGPATAEGSPFYPALRPGSRSDSPNGWNFGE
jgi:hypothetical protein